MICHCSDMHRFTLVKFSIWVLNCLFDGISCTLLKSVQNISCVIYQKRFQNAFSIELLLELHCISLGYDIHFNMPYWLNDFLRWQRVNASSLLLYVALYWLYIKRLAHFLYVCCFSFALVGISLYKWLFRFKD